MDNKIPLHFPHDLPVCPLYHPNSELQGRSGYYPNLTAEQLKCAIELKELVRQHGLDISDDYEVEFLKLLRFCRARKFHVQKAFTMLSNDVEWRANIAGLRSQTAHDVLQCDLKVAYNFFPTWVAGRDRQLRPVTWEKHGNLKIWELTKITTIENLVRFHAWEAEQAIRLMHDEAVLSGYNIETFVIVIDAANWHLGLATSDAFKFIQGMTATDSDHYPERLGACVVINAPSMLSIAWRIISTFLDEVTKKKVHILTYQADWLPVLLELMEEDQIPVMYGGTHLDPDPEVAFDSMNPPRPPPPAPAGHPSDLPADTAGVVVELLSKEDVSHGVDVGEATGQESSPISAIDPHRV